MLTYYDENSQRIITFEKLETLEAEYNIKYNSMLNMYINIDMVDCAEIDGDFYPNEIIGELHFITYAEYPGIYAYTDDCVYLEDAKEYATFDWARFNCFRCDGCGHWFYNENGIINTSTGTYCKSCCTDIMIYDYHDWNGAYFPQGEGNAGQNGNRLFLGFELEIDDIDDISDYDLAESVLRHYDNDFIHCERDSSVEFEFISQPATLELHRRKSYDTDLMGELVGYCRSHSAGTCGLHVHVNKDFFTKKSYNRLKLLINFYKQEIFKFSRRQSWNYSYANFGDDLPKNKITSKKAKKKSHGHNTWFNEGNSKTLEFRMFRGTLKHKTFMATLELVNSLCWLADSDINVISWSDIITYGDNRYCKEYSDNRNIYCDSVLDFEQIELQELEEFNKLKELSDYIFAKDGHLCYFIVTDECVYLNFTDNTYSDDRIGYKFLVDAYNKRDILDYFGNSLKPIATMKQFSKMLQGGAL